MDDPRWWLLGVSFVMLLTRFLTAAGVVRLLIQGTGLAWGLGIAVALSICLAPLGAEVTVVSRQSLPVALIQESLLGLCMGATLALLIAAIQFVNNFAFMASPWGLEPFGTPIEPLRKLFLLIAIAGFLQMQGDHIALRQLLESVRTFPPGQTHLQSNVGDSFVNLLSSCFRTSVTLAAPIVAAVLFTHLLMGMIGRSLSPAWFPALHGVSVPLMLTVLSIALFAWTSRFPEWLPSIWQEQLASTIVGGIP